MPVNRVAEEMKSKILEPLFIGNSMLTVESVNNHIYFYSEVNADRGLALIRELRELDSTMQTMHNTQDAGNKRVPIWLHINSPGGDLYTAFAIADQIPRLITPVYSVVEGLVASAATIISRSCKKSYILPNSSMLIHQFWTVMWGKHEEFKDEMVGQTIAMQQLVTFYAKHTKMSKKSVAKKLKHDFWVGAEQAIELGLVDGYKK